MTSVLDAATVRLDNAQDGCITTNQERIECKNALMADKARLKLMREALRAKERSDQTQLLDNVNDIRSLCHAYRCDRVAVGLGVLAG